MILILFIPGHISCQNYTVKTFTTENGLPNNDIKVIALDSTGFLWIGTRDGLSRFDGYEFKNYFHQPGDTTSLSFYSVLNLVVDKDNNLWILTENAEISLYDRINDNFRSFKNVVSNNEEVLNVNVDGKGNLWIICKSKLIKRDRTSGKFIQYKIFDKNEQPSSIDLFRLFDLYISSDNKIWLAGFKTYELEFKNSDDTLGKLIILNTYKIESKTLNNPIDFDFGYQFQFYESPFSNYWLFSNIGLFMLGTDKEVFREVKERINADGFSGNRQFDWSLFGRGLYSLDPETKSTRVINPETSQIVKYIFRQNRNMIWISVTSKSGTPVGLRQIVFTPAFFKNYLIEKEEGDLPAVFAITKDDKNNLWAGVRGKDHIIQFTPENKIETTGKLTTELFRLSGHIRSLVRVNNGIWIGYYNDLLMFYDFESGRFIRHNADEWTFRALAANKDGNLFIGATDLSIYYPGSGRTKLLWKSGWHQNIYKLLLDDKNNIWAGTSIGSLLKYNIINKESTHFLISKEGFHIEDICPDNDNHLWLATLGGGLCNFDPESGKSVFYTTASGLSNNSTYSILKEKSGDIWISTNDGISRLNTRTGQFRTFNNSDGLGITEFNSGASYISEDGEFFLGGMGGFVGFYPDSLTIDENDLNISRILLTDLRVSGEKKILPKPLNDSDTIILTKGENNFQLSYSCTDFINSDKLKFRYKLDGLNMKWTETDSHNRTVNYSNLKPGWYMLSIQASNRNGEWAAVKEIHFRITPLFYQTWFFRLSAPLILSILITCIIMVYIRQLKLRESQKQDTLRLQSLRGQMNPHFIFNSLNSINYFISNNDKISANRYIADFSRLIRSILSNMGNDFVPFESELISIKDYLEIEHLRFSDKFDYELLADESVKDSNPMISPGLVQPFIENAIWHGIRPLEGRKGSIRIFFQSSDRNRLICIVQDDGIGRIASLGKQINCANHKSRGISIVTERLQLISRLNRTNYTLMITDLYPDHRETGTRIEIEIPVKIN